MATSGLFNIGVSALNAFQRALDTTSHNIANVNTPGYSRQEVHLATRTPQYQGYGYVGKGVETKTIRRVYDGFVEHQVRTFTASSQELKTYEHFATQIDNLLADPEAGLTPALSRFFDAMQDLADDPASSAARQTVLGEAQGLADRFHAMDDWISGINDQVNDAISNSVDEINNLTHAIADLNQKIVLAEGMANKQPPNDMLDERDKLIRDLSQYLTVNTQTQDDGSVNIMVGNGQALVVGNSVTDLATYRAEGVHSPLKIALVSGSGGIIPISDRLTGGKVGGLQRFREEMLDPVANQLGRVAVGLGHFLNEQQAKGMDLRGQPGEPLFEIGEPKWSAFPGVNSQLQVSWNDIGQITDADYKLQYSGGSWSISRTDTGETLTMSGSGTAADPFVVDGVAIVVDPAAVDGDTFLIQPTRTGALDIDLRIHDPVLLAAASPVLAEADGANTGTAEIMPGEVVDAENPAFQTTPGALTPPILVQFTAADTYQILDNSNPGAPVVLETVTGYDPAAGADLFPSPGGLDYGYRVRLQGAAAAGDRFTIDYNSNGQGDNRNALAMADLQHAKVLGDGLESVSGAYRRLVSDTGTATRRVQLAAGAQDQMLQRATAEREAASGVNLDEEAANLMRYQQAYQAAAQVVAAANEMFDTLLAATRGR